MKSKFKLDDNNLFIILIVIAAIINLGGYSFHGIRIQQTYTTGNYCTSILLLSFQKGEDKPLDRRSLRIFYK